MIESVITKEGRIASQKAKNNNGPKVNITRFKIGSDIAFDPNENDTNVHNQVYDSGENPSSLSYRVDETHSQVIFRITLPLNVGPFPVGNLGLFLDSGPMYILGRLPGVSPKQVSNLPEAIGNTLTYEFVLQQELTIFDFSISQIDYAEFDEVATENDLPDPFSSPLRSYFVQNRIATNRPSLAHIGVGNTWLFNDFGPSATTRVYNGSAGPNVVMTGSDGELIINKTTPSATIVTLPPSPQIGQRARVSDGKGDAATNNITVVGDSGAQINGAANLILNTAYKSVEFRWGGAMWNFF